jgi:hypothetical protein
MCYRLYASMLLTLYNGSAKVRNVAQLPSGALPWFRRMASLKLYRSKEHSDHWVGEDKYGSLSLFPAKARGWASRTPYVGSRAELEEVSAMLARGTKWPGAIGGKTRDPSGKPSRIIGIRVTQAEREEWLRAAEARGVSLTEWLRFAAKELLERSPATSAEGSKTKRASRSTTKRSKVKP